MRNVRRNFKLEVSYIQQVMMSVKVANLYSDFIYSHVPEEGRKVELLHLRFF